MEVFDGRYEQEKLLGQGAFSEVWKVKDTQTGVSLALKIYNPIQGIDGDGNEMLTHEFALMVNANHKNLLRPLFFATCENRPYLILPFCERGNIGNMVGKFTEEEAWKLLRDAASGLAYLHAMNPPILHQDIKPANILLSDNGDYMLTDFGVSTQAKQSLSRVSNQDMALLSAGTISYMAPERFSRNNLPIMANDIYSLGSTVFEMLSGDLPFGNDGGLLQKKGADIPEVPGDFSPLLKKTLDSCLQEEPWKRPTAAQLEETAIDALKNPESRYIVAEKVQEAPEVQNIPKATTMQIPESYLKGTVAGNAGNAAPNVGGTVVGSSQTNMSDSFDTPKKSKLPLIAGIAAAVVALIVAGFFIFSGGSSESNGGDNETTLQAQQQADYDAAMALLNQDNPDSAQEALSKMEALAMNGYKDAIYQMAYTYAWLPNDKESVRRKNLLGWKLMSDVYIGKPVDSQKDKEAINWLEKSIAASDSSDYKSLYWLSIYYLNGIAVRQDMEKGTQLVIKSKDEAQKAQDFMFANNVDEMLKRLK
jgi:serine/threonine protein kinase